MPQNSFDATIVLFNDAVERNNAGVMLLDKGQHQFARQAFKDGIRSMKAFISSTNNLPISQSNRVPESTAKNEVFAAAPTSNKPAVHNETGYPLESKPTKLANKMGAISGKRKAAPNDLSTLPNKRPKKGTALTAFDHPIRLENISGLILSNVLSHCEFFITETTLATIMFNLALTHHLEGIQMGEPNFLGKSFAMYSVAKETLPEEGEYVFNNKNIDVFVNHMMERRIRLTMAILNNMGSICHDAGSFDLAEKLFDDLSKLFLISFMKELIKRAKVAGGLGGQKQLMAKLA